MGRSRSVEPEKIGYRRDVPNRERKSRRRQHETANLESDLPDLESSPGGRLPLRCKRLRNVKILPGSGPVFRRPAKYDQESLW